jgi:hypothetical protein
VLTKARRKGCSKEGSGTGPDILVTLVFTRSAILGTSLLLASLTKHPIPAHQALQSMLSIFYPKLGDIWQIFSHDEWELESGSRGLAP